MKNYKLHFYFENIDNVVMTINLESETMLAEIITGIKEAMIKKDILELNLAGKSHLINTEYLIRLEATEIHE